MLAFQKSTGACGMFIGLLFTNSLITAGEIESSRSPGRHVAASRETLVAYHEPRPVFEEPYCYDAPLFEPIPWPGSYAYPSECPGGQCRFDRTQPARRAPIPAGRSSVDLRAMMFDFESAVDSLFDEIRFGMKGSPAYDDLLSGVLELNRNVRHLREGLRTSAAPDHLQADGRVVLDSFQAVATTLQKNRSTFRVERAVGRIDRLMSVLVKELNLNAEAPAHNHSHEPPLPPTNPDASSPRLSPESQDEIPVPPTEEPEMLEPNDNNASGPVLRRAYTHLN